MPPRSLWSSVPATCGTIRPAMWLSAACTGSAPSSCLDGLVGDGRHVLGEHRLDAVAAPGRQVQEAHHDRAFLQPAGFFVGRLGDLGDQIGAAEQLFAGIHDPGAGPLVLDVGEPGPAAGILLDDTRLAAGRQQFDRGRRQADTMFVRNAALAEHR